MAHECISCGGECYCSGSIEDCVVDLTPSHCKSCGCEEDRNHDQDDDYESDDELISVFDHAESAEWVCQECGCHNEIACVHPQFGPCFWLKPNLCSHCVELKDDPAVLRPWQTENPA